MLSFSKKFNGKIYHFWAAGGTGDKATAKRVAKDLRRRGYNARVIKVSKGWQVWYR